MKKQTNWDFTFIHNNSSKTFISNRWKIFFGGGEINLWVSSSVSKAVLYLELDHVPLEVGILINQTGLFVETVFIMEGWLPVLLLTIFKLDKNAKKNLMTHGFCSSVAHKGC